MGSSKPMMYVYSQPFCPIKSLAHNRLGAGPVLSLLCPPPHFPPIRTDLFLFAVPPLLFSVLNSTNVLGCAYQNKLVPLPHTLVTCHVFYPKYLSPKEAFFPTQGLLQYDTTHTCCVAS